MKFSIEKTSKVIKSNQLMVRLDADLMERFSKVVEKNNIKKQHLIAQMIEHCLNELEAK